MDLCIQNLYNTLTYCMALLISHKFRDFVVLLPTGYSWRVLANTLTWSPSSGWFCADEILVPTAVVISLPRDFLAARLICSAWMMLAFSRRAWHSFAGLRSGARRSAAAGRWEADGSRRPSRNRSEGCRGWRCCSPARSVDGGGTGRTQRRGSEDGDDEDGAHGDDDDDEEEVSAVRGERIDAARRRSEAPFARSVWRSCGWNLVSSRGV